jgi:serine/threonine protein kinase
VSIPGVTDLVEIGRGGFGVVYQGREVDLDRPVAVKVLPVSLDQRARDRFERERRALGTLSGHPNIVTIYRAGVTDAGNPYLVMELLEGGAMDATLRSRGAIRWEEALALGVAVAGAIETAHRAGVLHRDIKPGNLLMSTHGDPKLADFGIARLQGAPETRSSAITASINHAAPEIIDGRPPSQASDIYALASTLFELVGGHAPFARPGDESIISVLARIARDPVPDLRAKGVPDVLARILEQGMAKDPAQRPRTAQAFGELLRDAQRQLGVTVTTMKIEGEAHHYDALADPSTSTPSPQATTGPVVANTDAAGTSSAEIPAAPLAPYQTGQLPADPAPFAPPVAPVPQPFAPPVAPVPQSFAPSVESPPPAASGSIPLAPTRPPTRRRTGVLAGVAAAVIVAAGAGVVVVTQGGGSDNGVVAEGRTPTTAVTEPATPAPSAAPASPTPLPTALPTPTQRAAPATPTPQALPATPTTAPTSEGGLGTSVLPGADEDYPAYDNVTDATGAISFDVPTDWADRFNGDGSSTLYQAARSLPEAFGVDAFDSPGVQVVAHDATRWASADAALDVFVEQECTPGDRGDTTLSGWVGRFALYQCPRGAVINHIYVVSPDGALGVFMGIQLREQRDLGATARMVRSLRVERDRLVPAPA